VPSNRVTKQIGLPEDLQYKLKMHALEKRKELQEITDEAMTEFFEQRDDIKKKRDRAPDYVHSPTNAKDFNVRLSKPIAAKVERVAKEDQATSRRLIYNGLLTYARRHKLIPD
jgi:hypothetical protein